MDRSAPNPIPNSWREGGCGWEERTKKKTVKERREGEVEGMGGGEERPRGGGRVEGVGDITSNN